MTSSYIEQINARNLEERKKIQQGVILQYLQDQSLSGQVVTVCEIAIALDMTTSTVRDRLNKLVKEEKIIVENAPYQNKLTSEGLVYRCCK